MPDLAARLPVVFIGHGSPMNTLADNTYTQAWRRLAGRLPRPKAILVISAHWYVSGTAVTAMPQPKTIHDFYGFPPELFAYEYPAPGAPAIASRVRALLGDVDVQADETWGLDHGAWSVLAHMYPEAGVPVLQLSIDGTQPAAFHLDVGRRLAPLRDEGVLILGSGNVVHNLRVMRRTDAAEPFAWAVEFNDWLRERLITRDAQAIVAPMQFGDAARLSIPTPEHYLPLIYVLGAASEEDRLEVLTDGVDLGSISMLSVAYGA
ncbi:MAG TPA: 4,5-DOPA dioxygenase extradiol [Steroidobacteraceae bacterium]|nr:4,5-DOPA dioxygenase extradiol [Steroidobacteraceae bacterium]